MRFVALDFETADHGADSACALGVAVVEDGAVATRAYSLIRPPRRRMAFSHIHGLTWDDVAEAPCFAELWPGLRPLFAGADFIAAHNAPFDRGVLRACCRAAATRPPRLPFLCTVRLARRAWRLPRNRLPDVCRHLGILLDHHQAMADAEACAAIVVAAARQGVAVDGALLR